MTDEQYSQSWSNRYCPKCGQKTDNITFDIEGQKSSLCQECLDERIVYFAEEEVYIEKIVSRIEGGYGHRLYKFILKFGDIVLRNSNVAIGEILETSVGFTLHRKEMIIAETPVRAIHTVIISMKGLRSDNGVKKPMTINPRVSSMIERIEEP